MVAPASGVNATESASPAAPASGWPVSRAVSERYELVPSNRTAAETGAPWARMAAATSETTAPSHSCATDTYLVPGVSVAQPLNQANSCVVAIEFPGVPEAKGKPLHAHYYGVKLEAGKTYTITITGLGGGFDPGLAVFAGGPVASSLPNGQAVTSRTVTVTPSTTRVHVIEIGSGHFTDGTFTTWVNPSGSYTLSVSQ